MATTKAGTTLTDPPAAFATLEIDLAALVANWRTLRAAHGGQPTAAVLKADAYGTGAAQAGTALAAAGCAHFFTAHLSEAVALRAAVPGAMIAALNGRCRAPRPVYVAHDIAPGARVAG